MQVNSNTNGQYYTQYNSNAATNEVLAATETESSSDYSKIIQEKINELVSKIKNGDTETTYEIGSQSYTEKEWDKLLENFDSIQDAVRELMREEQKKQQQELIEQKQIQKQELIDSINDDARNMLVSDSTTCKYPATSEQEEVHYITWYSEDFWKDFLSGKVEV